MTTSVIGRKTGQPVTKPNSVWTIGYAGRSLTEFIEVLRDAGIRRVVDVRELPLSRRKGFSKTSLSEALAAADIEYVHLRVAGNPFREQKADIETCLRLYAGHVDHHPEVLREVEKAIAGTKAALLCFEERASECHRSVLIDRLMRGHPERKVRHL